MDNEQPTTGEGQPKKGKSALGWTIIFGLILLVVLLVLLDRVMGVNIFTSESQRQEEKTAEFVAQSGAWHAVFLTNGQVYFGQLSSPEAQYALLKDVYYLQLQQGQQQVAVQPGPDVAQVVSAPAPEPPRLTLIKFGTELHGPQDFMQVNRDHILFWEELKPDSQVVQAVARYKEGL